MSPPASLCGFPSPCRGLTGTLFLAVYRQCEFKLFRRCAFFSRNGARVLSSWYSKRMCVLSAALFSACHSQVAVEAHDSLVRGRLPGGVKDCPPMRLSTSSHPSPAEQCESSASLLGYWLRDALRQAPLTEKFAAGAALLQPPEQRAEQSLLLPMLGILQREVARLHRRFRRTAGRQEKSDEKALHAEVRCLAATGTKLTTRSGRRSPSRGLCFHSRTDVCRLGAAFCH